MLAVGAAELAVDPPAKLDTSPLLTSLIAADPRLDVEAVFPVRTDDASLETVVAIEDGEDGSLAADEFDKTGETGRSDDVWLCIWRLGNKKLDIISLNTKIRALIISKSVTW